MEIAAVGNWNDMVTSTHAHRHETEPRVTTVVITRDSQQLPRRLDHDARPVIVVDNGTGDGERTAVRRAPPDVRVIELPQHAGSEARNVGAAAARSPYVAFSDDDSWWSPGALSLAADVLDAHPSIGLVAARVLVGEEARLDPFCEVLAHSPLPCGASEPGRTVLGFLACAVVVRREVLLQVGGFDPLTEWYGEEERVALDLADAGHRLCYLDDLVVRRFPAPGRDRNARRRRAARNGVLTAVLRLPLSTAVRRAGRHLREGVPGVLGVADALVRLPRALRRRRPVSRSTGVQARIIELAGQV
jgi:glycosyltransferase involved in cell wall biosynthesis